MVAQQFGVTDAVPLNATPTGGTRLTSHGAWTPHGWFRIVFPVFMWVMRRAERVVVAHARRALEERRDASATAVAKVGA